jgi:hypothetical protein
MRSVENLSGKERWSEVTSRLISFVALGSITLWHCSRVTVAVRWKGKKARNALRALISDLCN